MTTLENANALLALIEKEIQDCEGNTDNLVDEQILLLDAISALQSHAEKIEYAGRPNNNDFAEHNVWNFAQTGVRA